MGMTSQGSGAGSNFGGNVGLNASKEESQQFKNIWKVIARDKHGEIKWEDEFENIVVNAGLDHALDVVLDSGTQITTWYVGLTDGTPTVAAADTAASHAGWAEVTAYDEANRQTLTLGSVSSQSIDNVGNEAVFTVDTNSTTIGGAFIISDNTKGGTSGTLYAAGAFTGGDKSLDDDDTLTVTVTLTASSS